MNVLCTIIGWILFYFNVHLDSLSCVLWLNACFGFFNTKQKLHTLRTEIKEDGSGLKLNEVKKKKKQIKKETFVVCRRFLVN